MPFQRWDASLCIHLKLLQYTQYPTIVVAAGYELRCMLHFGVGIFHREAKVCFAHHFNIVEVVAKYHGVFADDPEFFLYDIQRFSFVSQLV